MSLPAKHNRKHTLPQITPSDFVVVKLDVESAEPVVLDRWFGAKGTRSDGCPHLIDVLAFEPMGEGGGAGYVTTPFTLTVTLFRAFILFSHHVLNACSGGQALPFSSTTPQCTRNAHHVHVTHTRASRMKVRQILGRSP